LATQLEKEISQEIKMPEDQGNNGKSDLIDASNADNVIHPTTIDQLPERLRKELEERNAAKAAAVLVGCSFKGHSSKVLKPLSSHLPLHLR
jgi:F420-0:gamma-glutamyl ligase